jgi:hypothetical protein
MLLLDETSPSPSLAPSSTTTGTRQALGAEQWAGQCLQCVSCCLVDAGAMSVVLSAQGTRSPSRYHSTATRKQIWWNLLGFDNETTFN